MILFKFVTLPLITDFKIHNPSSLFLYFLKTIYKEHTTKTRWKMLVNLINKHDIHIFQTLFFISLKSFHIITDSSHLLCTIISLILLLWNFDGIPIIFLLEQQRITKVFQIVFYSLNYAVGVLLQTQPWSSQPYELYTWKYIVHFEGSTTYIYTYRDYIFRGSHFFV